MPIIGSDGAIHFSAIAARPSPSSLDAMPSAASRSAAPSAVPSAPAYRQADRTAERAARGRSAQRRLTVIVSPAQASMENRPYTVMMSWYSPMPSIPMRSESTMR